MNADEIKRALVEITTETNPTLKHLKLASLVSAVFRERSVELVVVGASAIELYTEGAYVCRDIEMNLVSPARLDIRTRQELMRRLSAEGGPRSWHVLGQCVDIPGQVETLGTTPFAEIQAPYGPVRLVSPEDLLVERVLISAYPQRQPNEE